jgi:hypothetical protein
MLGTASDGWQYGTSGMVAAAEGTTIVVGGVPFGAKVVDGTLLACPLACVSLGSA